jgi:DNA (cytosine-5)-methyltransferase 1
MGGNSVTITVGSLFSGIGGLELGLERAGMSVVWQVEIDDYCRRVLTKHWPDVPKFIDVREVGAHNLEYVDVICGGFPCQDVSLAGTQAGLAGERSGLWHEFARVIREIRPRFVLVENVAALLSNGFGVVLSELATNGYDAEWDVLPAGYFGAPHRRERVFLLAHSHESDGQARVGSESQRARPIFAGRDCPGFPIWLQTTAESHRVDDGIPARIYEARVGALGNAVVPQVAEYIGRLIVQADSRLEGAA